MRANKIDFKNETAPLGAAVVRRRATPSFKTEPVPPDVLRELLELATMAPSGYNLQPWRFLVLRDTASRLKLKAAAYNQPKIGEAPVVIVACGDTTAWRDGDLDLVLRDAAAAGYVKDSKLAEGIRRNARAYLSKTDLGIWVTRQTMIAFTFLMLAAECRGLDTAPMEGFDEEKVRAAFDIPSHVRVIAMLALGYGKPPDKPYGGRFDLDRTVFEGRWGAAFDTAAKA